jgi:hypothetical protein
MENFSKSAILILVLVTVAVSFLGTLAILQLLNSSGGQQAAPSDAFASVKLQIAGPSETPAALPQKSSETNAKIGITIQPQSNRV